MRLVFFSKITAVGQGFSHTSMQPNFQSVRVYTAMYSLVLRESPGTQNDTHDFTIMIEPRKCYHLLASIYIVGSIARKNFSHV